VLIIVDTPRVTGISVAFLFIGELQPVPLTDGLSQRNEVESSVPTREGIDAWRFVPTLRRP
jgi:hypothetical protein